MTIRELRTVMGIRSSGATPHNRLGEIVREGDWYSA